MVNAGSAPCQLLGASQPKVVGLKAAGTGSAALVGFKVGTAGKVLTGHSQCMETQDCFWFHTRLSDLRRDLPTACQSGRVAERHLTWAFLFLGRISFVGRSFGNQSCCGVCQLR